MTHLNLTFRKHIITQSCHCGTEATLVQGENSATCLQFSRQIKCSGVYSIINEYIIETAKQVMYN